jgi:hypothetical protein
MGRLRPGGGGVPLIRVKSIAGSHIADLEPKIQLPRSVKGGIDPRDVVK